MGTDLAIRESKAEQFVAAWGGKLKNCAVREYEQNEFLRSAVVAITTDRDLLDLANTEHGQIEIYNALKAAAVTGLSLNPQEKKAALVIYGKKTAKADNRKVQYQTMKDGKVQLLLESGEVASVVTGTVYDNDEFYIEQTSDGDKYTLRASIRDRGLPIGYFASFELKSGKTRLQYVTIDEVKEHALAHSAALKSANSIINDSSAEDWLKRKVQQTPWIKNFDGMARKTAIVMLDSNVYLPQKTRRLLDSDQDMQPLTVTGPATVIEPETKGVSPEQAEAKLKEKTKSKAKAKPKTESENDQRSDDII
jgi:phage RecT family recombinase